MYPPLFDDADFASVEWSGQVTGVIFLHGRVSGGRITHVLLLKVKRMILLAPRQFPEVVVTMNHVSTFHSPCSWSFTSGKDEFLH